MKMNEDFEITSFPQKVRKDGGSLVITLDHKVATYENIKEGDMVKVMVKKLPKKKVE